VKLPNLSKFLPTKISSLKGRSGTKFYPERKMLFKNIKSGPDFIHYGSSFFEDPCLISKIYQIVYYSEYASTVFSLIKQRACITIKNIPQRIKLRLCIHQVKQPHHKDSKEMIKVINQPLLPITC